MSKEPIEYLRHILDECKFILSEFVNDTEGEMFVAIIKRTTCCSCAFISTLTSWQGQGIK